MNKRIYLVLFVAVMTASYAQAELTFGVRAGLNLTDVHSTATAGSVTITHTTDPKVGFQAGLVADYALSNTFSIQPAVVFATQGGKVGRNNNSINYRLNYIQVPINAIYKIDLGFAGLLLQAGPYFGYALNGNTSVDGSDRSTDIEFGSNNNELKPFDFGVGAGAGLQFGNLQLVLGYNFGFADLTNINSTTLRNNGVALTATILFGGR